MLLSVLHKTNRPTTQPNASSGATGSKILVLIASVIGVIAFAYPFLLPVVEPVPENRVRATEAPLLFSLVTALCLLAIAADLQLPAGSHDLQSAAKTTALLGVLVALDAALRLVPTFLGLSPIFLLIMLTGSVFGPSVGFQMGTLTLLVSALLTGGMGPWLPFQMLTAGWIGLTAGWLGGTPGSRSQLRRLAVLGALWGFGYGAVMNLWSWPFAAPGLEENIGLYWSPTLSLTETLTHYGRYYLVTSIWYDAFRAAGNVILVLALGAPLLRTLHRYRSRFVWSPWTPLNHGHTTNSTRI